MKVTDEMVTAGRAAHRACEVEDIRSNAYPHPLGWGNILPTQWYYGDRTFASFDEAKEAQQRDVVRAVLKAALRENEAPEAFGT